LRNEGRIGDEEMHRIGQCDLEESPLEGKGSEVAILQEKWRHLDQYRSAEARG
jgi:hypothetical protein